MILLVIDDKVVACVTGDKFNGIAGISYVCSECPKKECDVKRASVATVGKDLEKGILPGHEKRVYIRMVGKEMDPVIAIYKILNAYHKNGGEGSGMAMAEVDKLIWDTGVKTLLDLLSSDPSENNKKFALS